MPRRNQPLTPTFGSPSGWLHAPARWLIVAVLGFAAVVVIGLLQRMSPAFRSSEFGLDVAINHANSPVLDNLARAIDALDRTTVVAVILLVILVIVGLTQSWLRGIGVCLVIGLAWLTCLVPKQLVHEARPSTAALEHHVNVASLTLSYPSGHVTFAVAVAVVLACALRGRAARMLVTALLIVAALVVAWGRLYVGAHYPLDVLGGMIDGFAGAILFAGLWNLIVGRLRRGAATSSAAVPARERAVR